MYGCSVSLFRREVDRIGIDLTLIDNISTDSVKAAIRPNTRMVYLEPCTNPLANLVDIKQVINTAREVNKNILVCFDNTFLTPWILVMISTLCTRTHY